MGRRFIAFPIYIIAMRFLILGGSGLLGRELVERLCGKGEISYTYYNNAAPVEGAKGYRLDLADGAAIGRVMDGAMPDVVLHTVAPPSVDWHEKERALAYATNVLGTRLIAEKAKKVGAKLVYISTAFVFPDIHGKVFAEEDIPAPINFYGVTKHGAEIAAATNPNHLIIRTDQIFGWARLGQKKSFVVGTLEKLEKGQPVEVCRDWLNSPTYVKDLGECISALVEKDKRGIFHVVGNTFTDRVSWARKIAEVFGKDPGLVKGIESSSLNLPARRPNAQVSNMKVQGELGVGLRTLDEALKEMAGERK